MPYMYDTRSFPGTVGSCHSTYRVSKCFFDICSIQERLLFSFLTYTYQAKPKNIHHVHSDVSVDIKNQDDL
jgi:hypothetical protein